MTRLVSAVLFTIVVVAFAMSNTHSVTLSLLVGPPVRIRLIFLMMSTFIAGMLFFGLMAMALRLRIRRQTKATTQTEGDLIKN